MNRPHCALARRASTARRRAADRTQPARARAARCDRAARPARALRHRHDPRDGGVRAPRATGRRGRCPGCPLRRVGRPPWLRRRPVRLGDDPERHHSRPRRLAHRRRVQAGRLRQRALHEQHRHPRGALRVGRRPPRRCDRVRAELLGPAAAGAGRGVPRLPRRAPREHRRDVGGHGRRREPDRPRRRRRGVSRRSPAAHPRRSSPPSSSPGKGAPTGRPGRASGGILRDPRPSAAAPISSRSRTPAWPSWKASRERSSCTRSGRDRAGRRVGGGARAGTRPRLDDRGSRGRRDQLAGIRPASRRPRSASASRDPPTSPPWTSRWIGERAGAAGRTVAVGRRRGSRRGAQGGRDADGDRSVGARADR